MQTMVGFSQEMFVLYGIAMLGWIVRKIGILNEDTNDVLTQLILYITLPALIFFQPYKRIFLACYHVCLCACIILLVSLLDETEY